MSDDEEVQSEEEREEEPSEAEQVMKKRREQRDAGGLDEAAKELLEHNRVEREKMNDEIKELRARNEQRKKEREEEEKRLAAERAAEDARRKGEEEERKKKKLEEEQEKLRKRAIKMAEFEKWKNPPKPNFVISKREREDGEEEIETESQNVRKGKSKEQLEAEKRAILKQRIKPLGTEGFDAAKLAEKAKELHNMIVRLEGDKFDLERNFKAHQMDLMDLAERARQANKVGKDGLKRVNVGGENDKMQERFAGAPAKVEMYSKYERQKDMRNYEERKNLYKGPQFLYPAERIKPSKIVTWNEEGLPIYGAGGEAPMEVTAEA